MNGTERKDLTRRSKKHELALAGHGVIINRFRGRIWRLAVAYDGWCRIAENNFDVETDTVLGPAILTYDYETPEEAIRVFNGFKDHTGNWWRQEDRVIYDPCGLEEYSNGTI
jgi:hypothetical protein